MSRTLIGRMFGALMALSLPHTALAEPAAQRPATCPPQAGPARDGQQDFDLEFGTWATHVRRLQGPLSGSTTWVETWEVNWIATDPRRK
jgi:hypothetical protein